MKYIEQAIGKLKKETADFKGDQYEKVMYKDVSEVLISFCGQDDEFAQCIVESDDKDFKGCMAAVRKCVDGNKGVRDLTAFKAAVGYYFPGKDIICDMHIIDSGAPRITMTSSEPSAINLSFDSLF